MNRGEQLLYDRFKRNVATGPLDRVERIENGISAGTPDVNYCLRGTEGWVELKAPLEPKRPSTPLFGSNHDVSIDQLNWFHKQHMAGGIGWLLIGTDKRHFALAGKNVAALGPKINNHTVESLCAIAVWRAPLRAFAEDWAALRELLIEGY